MKNIDKYLELLNESTNYQSILTNLQRTLVDVKKSLDNESNIDGLDSIRSDIEKLISKIEGFI